MVYLGKNKKVKLSKKQAKAQKKQEKTNQERFDEILNSKRDEPIKSHVDGIIELPKVVTVRHFSETLKVPVTEIIKVLMKNGIMASINESIDFDTAEIVADEFDAKVKLKIEKKQKIKKERTDLKKRPPVVVVLGHVDHGKTTLLDAIRKTDIASGESGGITQHIGAYQVTWKDKNNKRTPITFLDTPGHEAFSAMRAHGANITDIAILVVAADDGVKPQTKEAISHIKSANVPVVVAINKIDRPNADPERVKRELADLDLNPEEWGGNTVMVPISAKKAEGIDDLLDMIILTSQMQELKAEFDKDVEGVVIESHMQSGVGPVATILINHGILKPGKVLVIGNKVSAKVRIMENYLGKKVDEAGPSSPVKVAGLSKVPDFGEIVREVSSEKMAREIIESHQVRFKSFDAYQASQAIKSGELKELNIILKTDTQGSLEAIKNTLEQLSTKDIKVKVLSFSVGSVTENDVNLAISSKALVFSFKTKTPEPVRQLADKKQIKITNYDIIYRLIEDVQEILEGMVEPELNEIILGKLEVIKQFHKTADRKLIGGKVTKGRLVVGEKVRIFRKEEQIGSGKVQTLQIEQNQVNEIKKGQECGLAINTKTTMKTGDIVEQYKIEEVGTSS